MIHLSFNVDTRRALEWGITWALAVAVCEALAMSPERWASAQLLVWWLTYWVIPLWCVIGALLVWLLNIGERRAGWRGMIVAFLIPVPLPLLIQPLVSLLMANAAERFLPNLNEFAAAGVTPRTQLLDIGLYNLWVYAFYGGLLTAVFVLTVRTERFRSRLHATVMARGRTEGLLDTERLQALQGQIDPSLLLDSMRDLERRYRSDAESAERLLEALVEFLRYAMHGLRIPVSTLEAEVRLAQAFSLLQRERGVEGYWRVSDEDVAAAGQFKFPSLLMLRLLALGGVEGRPLLRVRDKAAGTVLELFGLTKAVSDELRQQVQARLRPLYGANFRFDYSPGAATHLAIVLNRPASINGEQHA